MDKTFRITREQLKEIKLLLDTNGYTETKLKAAWRNSTNQELPPALSAIFAKRPWVNLSFRLISEYIRRCKKIYAMHAWLPAQRRCLERLGKQLIHEVIIDHNFVNNAFAQEDGAKRVDKLLDNQLDEVQNTLADGLWGEAS